MNTIRKSWVRMVLAVALGTCLVDAGTTLPMRAGQTLVKPEEKATEPQALPDADEQRALNDAFRSAQGNPQIVIKNMSDFLNRFPHTSRREIVLRTICSYGAAANSPGVVLQYGQMLIKLTPDDPQLLNLMLDALARQNDQPSRTLAIDYTSRLIKIAEAGRDQAARTEGNHETLEAWVEHVAESYARRGEFNRDSGDIGKATSDFEKAYSAYPTARVAELQGDVALSKGDSTRALDYYLTSFAFPDKSPDFARRQTLRHKLSSLYIAQYHSETGMGDRILSRYDELVPQLTNRLSGGPLQNTGVQDPLKFVVERPDGSPLSLAVYRGKVLVLDFWATWCGPCRLQGQIVDQVAANFRTDPNVVFLSLNVDEDRSGVPAFFKQAGWSVPMVYARGLNQLLRVKELPTLVIFDRNGEIVYRQDGLDPKTFADELTWHLRAALQQTVGSQK